MELNLALPHKERTERSAGSGAAIIFPFFPYSLKNHGLKLLLFLALVLSCAVYLVGEDLFERNLLNREVLHESLSLKTEENRSSLSPGLVSGVWLVYGRLIPSQAIEWLSQYTQDNPTQVVAGFRLGELLWEQDQKAEAMEVWRSIPFLDMYFAHQASLALHNGDFVEAEETGKLSLSLNPVADLERMFLFQELCRTFVLAKRESQALPWCQIAVDVQGNAWNLIYLGIAQIDLEELSIPLNTFLRAYSLSDTKETYFEVTKLLGQVYLKRGEFERAVGEYEKALASGGENNQWIHLGLAQALGQLGTWKEACQHLKRAMELGYSEYANTPFFSGRCEDH